MMSIKIALAGNPNSGKTTMFNHLTGSSQYVGNWPGVTVEKKEGKLRDNDDVIIQDLPGIYSLSPYTLEEVVTRNYLVNDMPDVIIDIVDASNIERNLYLTTQLLEIGVPVIVALNMIDVVRKNGDVIDIKKLSDFLGCEVIETAAVKGDGSKAAAEKAIALAEKGTKPSPKYKFSDTVEAALTEILNLVDSIADHRSKRFFAVKIFERDEKIIEQLKLDEKTICRIEEIIKKVEKELDDDSESIIINERYDCIGKVIKNSVHKKNKSRLTTSDKIDLVLTNRWLALPIFAVIMFLVYYISISTVGGWGTDWINDVLFGEIIPPAVEGFLVSVGCAQWLISLIVDGIIGGVGAILGFLPQMIVLFICLSILEDCGYMARIAFIMDKLFRKFGLSGKSFIPMLVATGCGVPGVMASRTIENESDRKITIMTTTFMPCSAKIPIIALIAGAMFRGSAWVAPSAYFVGIAAIVVSGIILKKIKVFTGDPAPFVMELPAYHMPNPKTVSLHVWDRTKSFVKKAGTVILLACVAVWFLSSFSWTLVQVETEGSILASLGKLIAPIFAPLGWGNWKATVSTLNGLIAKENVVGTLGVLYGANEVSENGAEVWKALQAAYTPLSAYSFMIFNLLCAPCFAAVGAIRREMGNAKWTFIALGYQTGLAYAVSLIIYQVGMMISGNFSPAGGSAAIILIAAFIYLLFKPADKSEGLVRKPLAS